MPATIAAELAEVVFGGAHYTVLFFLGIAAVPHHLRHQHRRRLGDPPHEAALGARRDRVGARRACTRDRRRGARRAARANLLADGALAVASARRCCSCSPSWPSSCSTSSATARPTCRWAFLTQAPTDGMTAGGIFPAIFGTVALVLLMTLAGVPVGVATAIYLHEYARPRSPLTRAGPRSRSHNLAGVPSIVFGLFGLGFFVQFAGRRHRQGVLRRREGLRPAGADLGRADHGRADAAGGDRRHRGGAARGAARAARGLAGAGRHQVPDRVQRRAAAGRARAS